jgi:hypothetical protein
VVYLLNPNQMIDISEYILSSFKHLHQSVETPKGLLGAMVARLTSISRSYRIRHQEVAGSSPAVVGSQGRSSDSFFALVYPSRCWWGGIQVVVKFSFLEGARSFLFSKRVSALLALMFKNFFFLNRNAVSLDMYLASL